MHGYLHVSFYSFSLFVSPGPCSFFCDLQISHAITMLKERHCLVYLGKARRNEKPSQAKSLLLWARMIVICCMISVCSAIKCRTLEYNLKEFPMMWPCAMSPLKLTWTVLRRVPYSCWRTCMRANQNALSLALASLAWSRLVSYQICFGLLES